MAVPKVAIIYDWLTNMGGAERVVLAMHDAFPEAPIYTSVFDAEGCPPFKGLDVRTTWLQKLPRFLRKRHQLFPMFRHRAFRALDLTDYDVVISISSAEAKAVRVRPGARHICYCLTPTRYYWSHYAEYRREPGLGLLNPLVRLALPAFVGSMRTLDLRAAEGVTEFVAISSAIADRITTYYGRESSVIYPPVGMQRFRNLEITGNRSGFVALGRQVPYKRIDLAVKVCTDLGLPLTVYGNGPEHDRLVAMAGPTVTFVVGAPDKTIADALARAEGFFFPQEEDFGIVQVEALAAGCPVIAYAKGGALDVVTEGKTGVFFAEQTPESVTEAVKKLQATRFTPKELQAHAETFSEENFVRQLHELVR
jgi:glycosyltransferase involved in cell wall biosynthesis